MWTFCHCLLTTFSSPEEHSIATRTFHEELISNGNPDTVRTNGGILFISSDLTIPATIHYYIRRWEYTSSSFIETATILLSSIWSHDVALAWRSSWLAGQYFKWNNLRRCGSNEKHEVNVFGSCVIFLNLVSFVLNSIFHSYQG